MTFRLLRPIYGEVLLDFLKPFFHRFFLELPAWNSNCASSAAIRAQRWLRFEAQKRLASLVNLRKNELYGAMVLFSLMTTVYRELQSLPRK